MPRWTIQLSGDRTDLAELAKGSASNFALELTDGGTALNVRCPDFDVIENANIVLAKGKVIAERLSGFCAAVLDSRTPLSVNAVFIEREDGTRHYFLFATITLSDARFFGGIVVTRADGSIVSAQSPGDRARATINRAESDPDLAKVLRLVGKSLDFVNLYRVFEVIKSRFGEDRIASRGWATKSEMERFRRTANHPDAAGDQARHAVMATQPPADPMSLSDAQTLIRKIVRNWLLSGD